MLGTLIENRLELTEQLGKGHLGIVYKAIARDDGSTYAVKVLQKNDERNALRFKREAKSASRQNHPNIAKVYQTGTTDSGLCFIVMEFVNGRPLRSIIRAEAPLPLSRVIKIATQICDALSYLHANGVVHKDLKPANIMIVSPGEECETVKLVDFGLAKHIDPEIAEQERVTLTGHVTGTPAYMSPEQCMARSVDARSDIYSLGCVMFRALTGLPPVTGASARDTMNKQVAGNAVTFSRVPESIFIPDEMKKVVERTLQRNPNDRFQTAESLKIELSAILNDRPSQ